MRYFLCTVVLVYFVLIDLKSISTNLYRDSTEFIVFFVSTSLLLIDFVAHLIFFGVPAVFKQKWAMILELILQIFSWIVIGLFIAVKDFYDYQRMGILICIFMIRALRVIDLFLEIKEIQIIYKTVRRLTSPFITMFASLYLILYTYA